VLVATSDARETLKFDNRKRFLRWVSEVADGRPIIFKLHPNEKEERARREILAHLPDALVFADGNVNHMIANCDVLITQYSSVVYVGMALGKQVFSYFDVGILSNLMPVQNGGRSARNIATVCHGVLEEDRMPQRAFAAATPLPEPAASLG
jgi:CDP-glycerol glycerophosphotransferase (TagB/SpsB family)